MSNPTQHEILCELSELRTHIQNIMSEVAAVRHPRASEDRLNAAARELDAIVSVTEGATNDILATAEKISTIADELSSVSEDPNVTGRAEQIADLAAELFTQCAFQDITGQRVNKVIGVLEFVEDRVTRIIDMFGGDRFAELPVPDDGPMDAEAALLNGPQDARRAVSQADIDALFP